MIITIKGKSVHIAQNNGAYSTQCKWCGKEIKSGKAKFYLTLRDEDVSCSMSHAKQMAKNKL